MDEIFDFDELHGEFCSLVLEHLAGKKTEEDIGFIFHSHAGLCKNFDTFLKRHDSFVFAWNRERLNSRLSGLFGHCSLPFNIVGSHSENINNYRDERDRGVLYENPQRLAHLHKYATRKVS